MDIRIRRSQVTTTPPSLLVGEPAYSEASSTLFIGVTGGGVMAIGGPGTYAKIADPTFTGAPKAPTPTAGDSSTRIATTAFVTTALLPSSQAVGTVLAAPALSSGTPSYRALVASDIPTLTASKISDFDAQVNTHRLDQLQPPSSAIAFNAQRITGLADPSSAQDAATQNYVLSQITARLQGVDWKMSVKVVATGNLNLSGLQTVDGISLLVGDRILVAGQSSGTGNGLYVVASGAWTRSVDMPTGAVDDLGTSVMVAEGTNYANTQWALAFDGSNQTVTVGTTPMVWTQISGVGQISVGTGLSKSGNTLSISTTYTGQNSITTLGTVVTGTWNASVIGVIYGGTGITTYAIGDLLYASASGALSRLAAGAAGQMLQMGSSTPQWSNTIDGGTF